MTGLENTRLKVAIVGGGVIGGGWAVRFLLHGWDVSLFDPEPGAERRLTHVLDNARRSLPLLADVQMPVEGVLQIADSLEDAVSGAKWVQESVPERLDLKRKVIASIQALVCDDVIIGSSTSGFKPSDLQQGAKRPGQIVVAHPFNPVYLLPVVEVVASEATSQSTLDQVRRIITAIGMKPLLVRKEIDAHIADRLLEAVWREGLWLVNDNQATTTEIDDAICYGFGLRWAQMGLFETYRLAGGEAGMAHFLRQFGPALKWPWSKLTDVPELTDELIQKIADQSTPPAGSASIQELERIRDDNLVGIMRSLKDRNWGVGQFLHNHDQNLKSNQAGLPSDQRSSEPLRMLNLRVLPSWIDYNGHMTEHRYLQVFGETTDAFLRYIGVDAAYLESGRSYFTVETHIRHIDAAKAGCPLNTTTQVIAADDKRLHLFHRVHSTNDGKVISTAEQMLLHVDTKANKVCAASAGLLTTLADITRAHSMLDRPHAVGRHVGQKK